MRKPSLIATLPLLFILATGASAQNPTMPSQERDTEKEALYADFSVNRRQPYAEQQRLAYAAAREYLRRFAKDKDPELSEVRKFVADYEKVMREQDLLNRFSAKHYEDTFKLGREILEHEPENFFALGIMSEVGLENARAGKAKSNAETIDYLKRAVRLLDDNKVTKPDPFDSIGFARGFLNAGLGSLLKDESPVEAAAAFLSAAKSESPFRTDAIIYHRLGVAILKGEFAQLSAEYNQKFTNKEPSPEQQAMLERLTRLAARATDAYARAVALSKAPQQQETRAKILEQLTSLYKNFHNNSDAGLNELISTVLSRPLP
jgi:tetratricopeptide (TPR) repeat protein